jgi:hydrogenase nickel incorporation protein HypA/HybF
MHELGIAEAIVAIAEEHAAGRRVEKVEVKIGHLRQVVPTALTFAFELVAEGTCIEGALLEIEDVPARIVCRSCGTHSRVTDFPFACPGCNGFDLDVVTGEELVVEALEVMNEQDEQSMPMAEVGRS